MTDNEKISLIIKYLFECDYYLKNDYINEINNFMKSRKNLPEDCLKLFEKKVRYIAFKEFSGNLERLIFGGYINE